MDDLAVHDGENRANLLDLRIGDRKIVAIEHGEIRKLTGLDRSDFVFHTQEPAVPFRKQTQSLLAGDLLIAVDAIAERVDACRRKVDVQPRVEWRDVDAVTMDAGLDTVIDNRPELRAHDNVRIR